MTNKGHNLVLADGDVDTLEDGYVLLGGVAEFNVLEFNVALAVLLELGLVWLLSAIMDHLVRRDNEDSDLVASAIDLGDSLNVVRDVGRIEHHSAHVEHDSSNLTDGQVKLVEVARNNEDDGRLSERLQEADAQEEEGPEVAASSAIVEHLLALVLELEAAHLFVGEGLDCANVLDLLCGGIAHLRLCLLGLKHKELKEVPADTGHDDLWRHESNADEAEWHVVRDKNEEATNYEAERLHKHGNVRAKTVLDDLGV